MSDVVSTSDLELRTDVELDPVCGNAVSLERFADDLILEFAGRLYAFCGRTCRDRFLKEPTRYAVAGRAEP